VTDNPQILSLLAYRYSPLVSRLLKNSDKTNFSKFTSKSSPLTVDKTGNAYPALMTLIEFRASRAVRKGSFRQDELEINIQV
jgi:hypothetical protein